MRCGLCKHARIMPDLKLHIYCRLDDGSVQSAFRLACNEYDENLLRRNIGFGLWQKLDKKKKLRN